MSAEPENLITELFMPCGDDVVTLLSQPALTDSFLNSILRNRGVYLSNPDRPRIIEEFVLSYFSPSEYEIILERLATKEESLKLKTFTHTIITDKTPLFDMVPKPAQLDVNLIAKDPNGNFEIEGAPSFVRKPSGDFEMKYFLRRRNAGRSFIRSQERFPGKILMRKPEGSKDLSIKVFHSSQETKTVNNLIKRWVQKDLRSRSLIKRNSEKSIEFGDFTHKQRMAFLMKFTQDFPEECFSFDKVTDFDFCVDDNLIPTSETRLVWMKGSVSRSSLKGKALHDLFVLKEKATWEFVKVWYIELRFKIATVDFDGSFSVYLEFDGYGSSQSPKSKFQFSLSRIASGRYKDSTEKIRKRC